MKAYYPLPPLDRRLGLVAIVFLTTISLTIGIVATVFRSRYETPQSTQLETPAQLQWGDVTPDSIEHHSLQIRNHTSEDVIVNKVKLSCDCVRVLPLPLVIKRGENTSLDISLISEHLDKFEGPLSLSIVGVNASDEQLFETTINLKIIGAR